MSLPLYSSAASDVYKRQDRTRFVWRDEAVCPFLFIADYWWTIVLITKMAFLRNSLIRGFLLGMGAFR